MTKQYLFPFEFVEKGSKIVIFGAGKVGQNYIQQLNLSNYCKLLFVVDDEYIFLCSYLTTNSNSFALLTGRHFVPPFN